MNQQIKGWTMYHSQAASKRTNTQVDWRIYRMVWHWCRRRHPSKSFKWIKKKYFPRIADKDWVFVGTLSDSKGNGWPIALKEAAKVRINRQVKIRSEVNPYDPEWELYLEARIVWKLEQTLAGSNRIEYVWKEQGGQCRVCGQPLQIEQRTCHIPQRVWLSKGGGQDCDNFELLHANCHRLIHAKAIC